MSNPQILCLLEDSGCRVIEYGIETRNNKILKSINKGFLSEDVQRAIELTREHDIRIQGSFIIGLPKESSESIFNTIDFAEDLDLDIYRWHIFQPSIRELNKSHVAPKKIFETYLDYLVPNMNLFSLYNEEILKKMLFFEQHFLSSLPERIVDRIGNTRLFGSDITISEAYYLLKKAYEINPGRFSENDMNNLLE